MKHSIFLKTACLAGLALGWRAHAGLSEVENFGSYHSAKELQSAWRVAAGAPELGLETNRLFAGGQAMRFTYAASRHTLTNAVKLTLAANQDWSAANILRITYGGAGREARSTNASDTILVQWCDKFDDVLGSYEIPGGTRQPPLTTATIDLANKSAFANARRGTGLNSVRSILLGVVATAPQHAGTVYFDSLSIGDDGNLVVNPGFQDLDHDGKFGDGWSVSGHAGFKNYFPDGNPGHLWFASRTPGEAGDARGTSAPATAGGRYRFTVDAAFETHWNAQAQFGLEFIAADHTTVLARAFQNIYAPNPEITTYRSYSLTAAAPAGTVFVRPVLRYTNSTGAAESQAAEFDNARLVVATNQVLSILGSSVANGWKASGFYQNLFVNGSVADSYGGDLTEELRPDHWRVVSQSIPGNATPDVIRRFYRDEIPVGADAVFIGLSLGNEGLAHAKDPGAICRQYYSGITKIVALARANHILPVIGGNYPKDTYTADEYARLKQVDLQINALDVPSVNFLGATDDGKGHWVHNSFINLGAGDTIHPNSAGHYEMFLTIVPSLFDAVKAGKPAPHWGNRARCLRLRGDASCPAPLSFTPDLIMHSFTVSFRVRTAGTGTLASITLPAGAGHASVEMTPTGIDYVDAQGAAHASNVTCASGTWREVVIAHQYARGKTFFYVDGRLVDTIAERLTPVGFVLGGRGLAATRPNSPAEAEYQDWFVYRSLLNAGAVRAQHAGALQQASLELYAPLDDRRFTVGSTVANRAQSLSAAFVNGAAAAPSTASAR
jgi:lysophospholipase L1-like esterase